LVEGGEMVAVLVALVSVVAKVAQVLGLGVLALGFSEWEGG
jgi:hypothetical protein